MPGQTLKIDTGCLVAMTKDVRYDIQFVGGLKNTIFGGEGLFFATLTGPGDVWIQSLPFSRLADRVIAAAPQVGSRSKDEGSISTQQPTTGQLSVLQSTQPIVTIR